LGWLEVASAWLDAKASAQIIVTALRDDNNSFFDFMVYLSLCG